MSLGRHLVRRALGDELRRRGGDRQRVVAGLGEAREQRLDRGGRHAVLGPGRRILVRFRNRRRSPRAPCGARRPARHEPRGALSRAASSAALSGGSGAATSCGGRRVAGLAASILVWSSGSLEGAGNRGLHGGIGFGILVRRARQVCGFGWTTGLGSAVGAGAALAGATIACAGRGWRWPGRTSSAARRAAENTSISPARTSRGQTSAVEPARSAAAVKVA